MMRSFAAIVGGFLAYALLMGVTMVALSFFLPAAFAGDAPRTGWAVGAELAYSVIFAAFGGYITALIARRDEVTHAGMLAAIILAMSVINLLMSPMGMNPPIYEATMILLSAVSAVLGGVLRFRQTRVVTI